ncbi:MAG TPA: non-ribosomal peptide synthetase [Clostridiales bacterium]|nr:non-ribosomal peptide synthetase [Clostridiales bacterium]
MVSREYCSEVLTLFNDTIDYGLTYPQKSIWYLEKLNPGTGIGNIAATLKVDEDLDYDLANQSINLMIRRNDAFRMRFREKGAEVRQYLAPYREYRMERYDFSGDSRENLYSWDQEQTKVPFRLLDSDLFYFAYVVSSANSCGIYVRIHHLITDAWSLVQIANEFISGYYSLKNGQPLPEEKNPSYLEYIDNEQKYLQSEQFARDKAYWQGVYADVPELTTLKSLSTSRLGLKAKRRSFILPDKLTAKIKEHCRENRTSLFALYFAALCIYINRIKGVEDITIGTPVLNRTNAREKKTIGMFISTVPLRIKIDGELSYVEFSRKVDKEWFSVLKHQKYPYDCLIRDVREQNKGVDKLFDLAFSYQNAKIVKNMREAHQEARWHFNECQVESLYIHLNEREDDGKILLNYDFLTDAYFVREIEFIHDHIIRLLWHALDNPTRQLSSLQMISESEREKILVSFNNTQADYPLDATVGELFARQAARSPEAPAVTLGDRTLSYGELNAKANILARFLRGRGVGPEKIVALLLPRVPEMIVAILGTIKAGGAYLPIDPEYPADRISYMLDNSQAGILLTCGDRPAGMVFSGETADICQLLAQAWTAEDRANLPGLNRPGDLLYVIYTSGSTGKPKGAMIEHRNVVRLLFNDKFQFDFGPDDCWTLFHSFCFDFSVWEMYGALLKGGRLVIVPRAVAQDTQRFLDLLIQEKVTVLNQTPAAFYNLADADSRMADRRLCLRTVIFGGEALKPVLLKPFRERYADTKLINMYGITETTVHVTYLDLSEDDIEKNICNVGRPIPTNRVYILDKHLNPLPIGIPGEICVGGAGVGRGYLNNPELTAEKFVPDPFRPGEILYRSGDLGRYFAQGDIEYLGRIDNQVKIRGHRIELGEIESLMLRFGKIRQAVVLTRDLPNGGKQLCAYYVPRAPFDPDDLREYLSGKLPEYMIPSCFINIEQIPLSSNGKVDRRKLPDPDEKALARKEYLEPQNGLQEAIAQIWEEVLGIARIGINDNFFSLGGDSLSAVAVVTKIGSNITFADLYRYQTIRTLADAILQKGAAGSSDNLLLHLSVSTSQQQRNLICFPYGGGNGPIYKDLADAVVNTSRQYNVYAVNIPGREIGRQQEYWTIGEIATRLVDEIKLTVKGEIILYGHCVGSALALETARLIQKEQLPLKAVYLGGILPPGGRSLQSKDFDPWRYVPDQGIMKFLNRIGLPKLSTPKEYRDILIGSFRHDARNYYRYFSALDDTPHGKLKAPIHSVIGDKDFITRNYQRRYNQWQQYSDTVRLHVLKNARHYFIRTNALELAAILTGPE